DSVTELVRVLGIHLGPEDILLKLGVKFDPGSEVEDVAQAVEQIERRIREEDPRVTRVFIEPEVVNDEGGLQLPF
ncbi:MAG: hypothetical protein ACWGON_10900, partial [Gemmatimonadota bacterium]